MGDEHQDHRFGQFSSQWQTDAFTIFNSHQPGPSADNIETSEWPGGAYYYDNTSTEATGCTQTNGDSTPHISAGYDLMNSVAYMRTEPELSPTEEHSGSISLEGYHESAFDQYQGAESSLHGMPVGDDDPGVDWGPTPAAPIMAPEQSGLRYDPCAYADVTLPAEATHLRDTNQFPTNAFAPTDIDPSGVDARGDPATTFRQDALGTDSLLTLGWRPDALVHMSELHLNRAEPWSTYHTRGSYGPTAGRITTSSTSLATTDTGAACDRSSVPGSNPVTSQTTFNNEADVVNSTAVTNSVVQSLPHTQGNFRFQIWEDTSLQGPNDTNRVADPEFPG